MSEGVAALHHRRFRAVHLSEEAPFRFALVMHGCRDKETTPATDDHLAVVNAIQAAGIDVTVMEPTENTKSVVVLLLNPQRDRLLMEVLRMNAEREGYANANDLLVLKRAFDSRQDEDEGSALDDLQSHRPAWHRGEGELGKLPAEVGAKWERERFCSYADEVLCISRILSGPVEPALGKGLGEVDAALFRGAGVDFERSKEKRKHSIVKTAFPLHDDLFVHEFLELLKPHSANNTDTMLGDSWFVEELRYHFGERVAFYYAWQTFYTTNLQPIALLGIGIWILFRVVFHSALLYFRTLALYGFLVATVWGPAVLRFWQQHTHQLLFGWGLTRASAHLDPNPDFDDHGGKHTKLVKKRVDERLVRHTFLRFADAESGKLDLPGFERLCAEAPGMDEVDGADAQKKLFEVLDKDGDGAVVLDDFLEWCSANEQLNFEITRVPNNPPESLLRKLVVLVQLFVLSLFLAACVLLFVYWYVSAKLMPVCTENDTRSWPSCFNSASSGLGTDRWLYILIQGIVLGIFLDTLLEAFVKWVVSRHSEASNFTTLKEREDYYTRHLFGYLYIGWFLWYALLGLVYVPFGKWIQTAQEVLLGEEYVNEWVPGVITMDTAMVTPLIVTQLLNLVLDTLVPYVQRRLTETQHHPSGDLSLGRPVSDVDLGTVGVASPKGDAGRGGGGADGAGDEEKQGLLGEEGAGDSAAAAAPASLAQATVPTTALLTAIKDDADLAKAVYAVGTFATWVQPSRRAPLERAWKSASHIVTESEMGSFNVFSEMLDPAIQFSYVVNFSAIWPMTALCAYLNNVLEVRFDAFKMLYGERRCLPRKVQGIGAWYGCLVFAAVAGLFFTVGMITVASSGLEAFVMVDGCGLDDDDFTMTPAIGCMGAGGGYRVTSVLVMEHISLLIAFLVYRAIPSRSQEVQDEETTLQMAQRLEFERELLKKSD